MLDTIYAALPGLEEALHTHPYLTQSNRLAADLRRLLLAHAPSGGAWLPGAIGDDIGALAAALGLADHFIPNLERTGNAALALGAPGDRADIILSAHMDRPSFRVRNAATGELFPMCSIRTPGDSYRAGAKALRFLDGRMQVSARGTMLLENRNGQLAIHFQAEEGELAWQDVVVMAADPQSDDGRISGTGLDNCLGVISALGAAYALRAAEDSLRAQGRRILIVFSDQEEGIPEAYFGHGAARLAGIMPAPKLGVITVDAQTVGAEGIPALGRGGCFGTVSAWSRGSVVPPNYVALGIELAAALNAAQPGCVQINTGYLSRSDDMPLGRWTQILGMIGPAMLNPHTVEEQAYLPDVQQTITWLSVYTAAALGLSPAIKRRFVL